jgi:hypothetical protein
MKKSISLFGLLLFPALLGAQSSTTLAPYVGADAMAAGDPLMVGVTLGWEIGYVGLRWGVGLDAGPPSAAATGVDEARQELTTSGLDAMVFLRNPRGGAQMIPYAVGGLGVRLLSEAGNHEFAGTWTAGGGVRMPVIGPIALEGEARHVQLLAPPADGIDAGRRSGVEFRAGLSVRFGGGQLARPSAPPIYRPAGAPAPLMSSSRPVDAGSSSALVAVRAISEAERHLGVTYRWGGNTPDSGFDCSGFTRYVYRLQGIDLPRVSQDQARVGTPLPLDLAAFQPGDLLAFASNGTIDHIAIYAGEGRIIHSSSSGGGVRYDTLTGPRGSWFMRHMVAARRVIPGEMANN